MMKAMERLVKNHIPQATDSQMGSLQFAYRVRHGVDGAKIFIIDTIYKNLEHPNTTARLLFANFSSAFNTLQPHILAEKLTNRFRLDDQLILWIIDFQVAGGRKCLSTTHSLTSYTHQLVPCRAVSSHPCSSSSTLTGKT